MVRKSHVARRILNTIFLGLAGPVRDLGTGDVRDFGLQVQVAKYYASWL